MRAGCHYWGAPKKLIAWARWQSGAGPGEPEDDEPPLWDLVTASGKTISPTCGERECWDFCGADRKAGRRCAECPAPTLLPECVPAVHAYQTCSTQWRVGANGRTGLDYPACRIAITGLRGLIDLPPWPELLRDMQVIERAFLTCDSEQRARASAEREAQR